MNELFGTLTRLEQEHGVLLADVRVTVDGQRSTELTTLMLQAGTVAWQPGDAIALRFKETEIALAKGLQGDISLRNRERACITAITPGKLLTAVQLQFGNWPLTAVITTGSAQRLHLQVGDDIEWLVKANEMQIQRQPSAAEPGA